MRAAAAALMLAMSSSVSQLDGAAGVQAPETRPPAWLAALIAKLEREPVANLPARIAQIEYRGRKR